MNFRGNRFFKDTGRIRNLLRSDKSMKEEKIIIEFKYPRTMMPLGNAEEWIHAVKGALTKDDPLFKKEIFVSGRHEYEQLLLVENDTDENYAIVFVTHDRILIITDLGGGSRSQAPPGNAYPEALPRLHRINWLQRRRLSLCSRLALFGSDGGATSHAFPGGATSHAFPGGAWERERLYCHLYFLLPQIRL